MAVHNTVGSCREEKWVDVGNGTERCLIGSGNITRFNGAMFGGMIKNARIRLR